MKIKLTESQYNKLKEQVWNNDTDSRPVSFTEEDREMLEEWFKGH